MSTVPTTHQSNPIGGILTTVKTDELRPLPHLNCSGVLPTGEQLLAWEKFRDSLFEIPIRITHEGYIVVGYPAWLLAKNIGCKELLCLVVELTSDEALRQAIQLDQHSPWLSKFTRVELALQLSSLLQERARENQRHGGRLKGKSILTEADRRSTRQQIAELAGVSTGNVSKVQRILRDGCKQLIDASRRKKLSISAAEKLSRKFHREQQDHLINIKSTSAKRIKRLARQTPGHSAPRESFMLSDFRQILLDVKGVEQFVFLGELIQKMLTLIEENMPDTVQYDELH